MSVPLLRGLDSELTTPHTTQSFVIKYYAEPRTSTIRMAENKDWWLALVSAVKNP
jgi:hypothetical protein